MTTTAENLARRTAAERAAVTHPAAKAVRLTGPQAHALFVQANGHMDHETFMGYASHKASTWRALAVKGLVEVYESAGCPESRVPARVYKIEITEAGLELACALWG